MSFNFSERVINLLIDQTTQAITETKEKVMDPISDANEVVTFVEKFLHINKYGHIGKRMNIQRRKGDD